MPACVAEAPAAVDLARSLRQRLSLAATPGAAAQEMCKLFMLGKPHAADCQARRVVALSYAPCIC